MPHSLQDSLWEVSPVCSEGLGELCKLDRESGGSPKLSRPHFPFCLEKLLIIKWIQNPMAGQICPLERLNQLSAVDTWLLNPAGSWDLAKHSSLISLSLRREALWSCSIWLSIPHLLWESVCRASHSRKGAVFQY